MLVYLEYLVSILVRLRVFLVLYIQKMIRTVLLIIYMQIIRGVYKYLFVYYLMFLNYTCYMQVRMLNIFLGTIFVNLIEEFREYLKITKVNNHTERN